MADKRARYDSKKSRKSINLEMKRKIVDLHKSGMKVKQLASKFELSHSTISTILKDKERYLSEANSSRPPLTTVMSKRSDVLGEMEGALVDWIKDNPERLNQAEITAKALAVFEAIKSERGAEEETFIASKGWYDRFLRRSGLLERPEPAPPTEEEDPFTTDRLFRAFRHIESALGIFLQDDPNAERSFRVAAAIRDNYSCYRNIYVDKKTKTASKNS